MKLIVIIALIGVIGVALDYGAGVTTSSGANTVPAPVRDISVRDASRGSIKLSTKRRCPGPRGFDKTRLGLIVLLEIL